MSIIPKVERVASMWHQETQQKEKLDWTHFLSADSVGLLRSVLLRAYKHREAYFRADDIKSAQIWSAMLEMQRQIDDLNAKIDRLTPKDRETMRLHLPEESPLMKKLQELTAPKAQNEKEATNALINSLMKF